MTHSYDVVGYAHSGYATCPEHTPENEQNNPIFEGDEVDSDVLCDVCYGEAFTQGLSGNDLRDACLIVGKNIWFVEEIRDMAVDFLVSLRDKEGNGSEKQWCINHALFLLTHSYHTIALWERAMETLINSYDDLPSLFPEIAERYQETYGDILEEVQDYLKSKTNA